MEEVSVCLEEKPTQIQKLMHTKDNLGINARQYRNSERKCRIGQEIFCAGGFNSFCRNSQFFPSHQVPE
jgi:hypothetical protein